MFGGLVVANPYASADAEDVSTGGSSYTLHGDRSGRGTSSSTLRAGGGARSGRGRGRQAATVGPGKVKNAKAGHKVVNF